MQPNMTKEFFERKAQDEINISKMVLMPLVVCGVFAFFILPFLGIELKDKVSTDLLYFAIFCFLGNGTLYYYYLKIKEKTFGLTVLAIMFATIGTLVIIPIFRFIVLMQIAS